MNCNPIKTFSVLVGALLLGCSSIVSADIELDRAEAIAWLLSHQNGDGSWGKDGARTAVTSEVLQALHQSGMAQGYSYSRALSFLANTRSDSIDSLARKIVALENANFDTQSMGLVDSLITQRNLEKAWGSFNGFDSGFPDTALALQAIILSGIVYDDTGFAISRITSAQAVGDFGWSYLGGTLGASKNQQILPTAYNLVALSAAEQIGYSVSGNIIRGLNWLVNSKQQADGSFLDNADITTGAVLTTALSYLAIESAHSVGVNTTGSDVALTAAQNYLLVQQAGDGSWNNDALYTALVLRTFPATTMTDTDADGVADAVELILGTNPNQPDAEKLISGNGLDPDGLESSQLNVAPIVLEVGQNQALLYTPVIIGGSPDYNWQITSGTLPAGITLAATGSGQLSGTPTQSGLFQLMANVTDAQLITFQFPISIAVIAADDLNTDTDGDGLWSSFEIANGSDPLNKNSTSAAGVIDTDKDGLPDTWENTYGFDLNDPSDAKADTDNDGWTNVVEFQRGTDPKVQDSPILGQDIITLSEDTSSIFNVTDNDLNGDVSTLSVLSTVGHGVLINNGSGSFTYQPNSNYFGVDTFTYQLCATNGLCSSSAVQITVNSVNDAPIANAGTDKNANAKDIVTLNSSSTDIDGSISTITWSQISGTAVSIGGVSSSKATFVAPVLTTAETLVFKLTVTDNNGASASDQVNVNVAIAQDRDGDGYYDVDDAFPDDPLEWLDTDGDGIGNNADPDDDNDGMSDVDEIAINRNPLVNEAVIMIIIKSLLLN